jgi:hypothetical protein
MTIDQLPPGARIRVVEQIDRREGDWTTAVEGTVVEVLNEPTGSWYAHGKRDRYGRSDRYWLKRVKLRKDDGEISVISLDSDSRVYLLDGAAAPAAG